MSAVALTMDRSMAMPSGAASEGETLRKACNEFLGMTMFSKMLKQARENSLGSDLFGSSAGSIFQSQLDDVLLKSASASENSSGMFGELGDALYENLSRQGQQLTSGSVLDVQAE